MHYDTMSHHNGMQRSSGHTNREAVIVSQSSHPSEIGMEITLLKNYASFVTPVDPQVARLVEIY